MRSIYQNTSCLCLLCCLLLLYAWLPLESAFQLAHGSLKQLLLSIYHFIQKSSHSIGKAAMREYKGKCSECMQSILRHNAMAIILTHIRYSALENYLAVPTSRFSHPLSPP